MLGELISESHGKRTARRVLSTSPTFKVEVSFEDDGKVLLEVGDMVRNQGGRRTSAIPSEVVSTESWLSL